MKKFKKYTEAVVMLDLDFSFEDSGFIDHLDFERMFFPLTQKLWSGIKWKINWRKSPSGKGWHFWAKALNRKRLPTLEIILVQALCESDIRRERGNFWNAMAGTPNWNRLFSTRRVPILCKLGKNPKFFKKGLDRKRGIADNTDSPGMGRG